jgi:hypothetical protein
MERVAGVAARAPFGDVGLADDDGAGALEHRDNSFILGRDVVREQHAAEARRQPLGVDQILDPERQPVQRAEAIAAHHGSLALPRRRARRLERACNDRIDGGIDFLDPVDATVHEFDRRKLALADQRPGRYRGQIARLGHVRITLP